MDNDILFLSEAEEKHYRGLYAIVSDALKKYPVMNDKGMVSYAFYDESAGAVKDALEGKGKDITKETELIKAKMLDAHYFTLGLFPADIKRVLLFTEQNPTRAKKLPQELFTECYPLLLQMKYDSPRGEAAAYWRKVRNALHDNTALRLPADSKFISPDMWTILHTLWAILSALEAGQADSVVEVIGDGLDATMPYGYLHQGPLTNALPMVRSQEAVSTIDAITGTVKFEIDSYSLQLPKGYPADRIRQSLFNLFDFLIEVYTSKGARSAIIETNLKDYMQIRGLSDRKTAYSVTAEDLETLHAASIRFLEKYSKKPGGKDLPGFLSVRLTRAVGINKRGEIVCTLDDATHAILAQYPTMIFPHELYKLNAKHNPHSRAFLRKIAEHKRMNAGKKNEDIISVKTLLKASTLPTYKAVMEKGRQVMQLIIEPFERDMNVLESIKWEYCHKNGEPLTQQELDNFDYSVFSECNIKITWLNYPPQNNLIAAREKATRKRGAKNRAKTGVTVSKNGGNGEQKRG